MKTPLVGHSACHQSRTIYGANSSKEENRLSLFSRYQDMETESKKDSQYHLMAKHN